MSTFSTHVLDTSLGKPAAGISVRLTHGHIVLGEGVTDADGRIRDILSKKTTIGAGDYTLTFQVADYFSSTQRKAFYRQVIVCFSIGDTAEHYHVPLLLSPFGYSTYRGS